MSNKKWHDDIPAGGVLCKENSSGSIVRIMGKSDFDGMVVDDCLSQTDFDIDEMTPLTAAEWWDFAPWQDMKDAPLRVKLLMMYSDNVPRLLYFDRASLEDDIHPIKWLPLPQVSK